MSKNKDRAFTVRFTEEQFHHIKEQSDRAMMTPNQLTVLANMGQISTVYLEQVHEDLSRLYDKFFALADKEVRQ